MNRFIALSAALITGFYTPTFTLNHRNEIGTALTRFIQHPDYEAFKTTYEQASVTFSTEEKIMMLEICNLTLEKKLLEKNKQLEAATAASDKVYKNMGITIGLPALFGTLFALMGVCSLASPLWDDTAISQGTIYFGGALIPAAGLLYFFKHNLNTWLHTPETIKKEIEQLELINAFIKTKTALVTTSANTNTTRR